MVLLNWNVLVSMFILIFTILFIYRKRIANLLSGICIYLREKTAKGAYEAAGFFQWVYISLNKVKPRDKSSLDSLAAVDNVKEEDIKNYEKELSQAFVNSAVQNVALTGHYGSGKSSIIKTFFKRNNFFRPVYISLGSFKDEEKDVIKNKVSKKNGSGKPGEKNAGENSDSNHEEQEKINKRIELSILQQLFYHVKSTEIPFSRFKRIRHLSRMRVTVFTALIFSLTILSFYFNRKNWKPLLEVLDWTWPTWKSVDFWGIWIMGGSLLVIIYYLVDVVRLGIIKLNVQGNEVEISKEVGLSILNEHIDEILYFFSSTKFDVLVIEDLDRFKNQEIFVKLREICSLVNNSKQVKRKISFLYALRDDVFTDENRTKFFDLIIPVVPFINASNSASELIKVFKEEGIEIPDSYLIDFSLFITDRRLIKNILNEFKIYFVQLNNPRLDNVRLLSLIVYKNINPTDYSLLQENKGALYELFQKRDEIRKGLCESLEKEIEILNKQLELVERRLFTSQKELRLIYLAAFFQLAYEEVASGFSGKVLINERVFTLNELTEDVPFSYITSNGHINLIKANGGYYRNNITFKKVEEFINPHEGYFDRERQLMGTLGYDRNQIVKSLSDNNEKLNEIHGYTFTELLSLKKLASIDTPINSDPRLTFLINKGHIREDYSYYLSYFKPGQLTQNDLAFILAVKQGKTLDWDHKLEKFELVADRISESECGTWGVVNLDLLNYLLVSGLHSRKLKWIMLQLSTLNVEGFRFIEDFRYRFPLSFGQLIASIIEYTDRFWSFIVHESHQDANIIEGYFRRMIEFGSLSSIKNQDYGNDLSNYIENTSLVFINRSGYDQNFIELIQNLNVKLKIPPVANPYSQAIRDVVYEKRLYDLNKGMVEFMISSSGVTNNLTTFNKGQASNILKHKELEQLANYLKEDLGKYIDEVYTMYDNHDNENVETILIFIKSDEVGILSKERIIATTPFQLDYIGDVLVEIWDILLKYERISVGWYNVMKYIWELGITGAFIDWIKKETVYNILKREIIPEEDEGGEELNNEFKSIVTQIMIDENVQIEVKSHLLEAVKFKISEINLEPLCADLVRLLVPKLDYSIKVATYLKDKLPDLFITFVKKYWEEFLNSFGEIDINQSDIVSLFKSGISDSQEEALYSKIQPGILLDLKKAGVGIPVKVFVLENLKMDGQQIRAFMNFFSRDEVIFLIIANLGWLREDDLKEILLQLGGEFKKVGTQTGKEVAKSFIMVELLKSLEENSVIVRNFTEKNKIIQVEYIK